MDNRARLASANQKMLPLVKQKLRQKVPYADLTEVRRSRLPFHEALLIELKESRFENAHKFFSEIIQFDLDGSKTLTSDKKLLEMVFNELIRTEHSTKDDGIKILVKLGGNILEVNKSYNWLADKIYSRALVMIKHYKLEECEIDAVVQHAYGTFLSEIEWKHQEAVFYLNTAHDISSGADEWFTEENLKTEKLNTVIAKQLCKTLIKLSDQVRSENPESSLETAIKSMNVIRHCKDRSRSEIEAKSAIAIGNCFMALKDFRKAPLHFEYAFEMAQPSKLHQIGIEALWKISECRKSSNDDGSYVKTLIRALSYAKQCSIDSSEGDVSAALGRFWIEHGNSGEALKYLAESAKIYEKTGEKIKLQRIRLLMALPLGKF